MKTEYDVRTLKEKPHPLQTKIDSGEITLKNTFDIPSEEFEKKLLQLSADERKLALMYWNANHKTQRMV
ncbi:MAG: hypothetical protein FWB96_00135 [Defluviitaleaceae bacterium]|nr:hypothetical protein [Defluviitaleaceae bacterium]MCL2262550.1 hypothetical protein [Defluviitaleaceae bacterium]